MGDALSVPFIVSWQESILGVLDNPRVIVITIKTSKLRLDVNKIECTKFILILLLQTAELTYAGKAVLVRCRQGYWNAMHTLTSYQGTGGVRLIIPLGYHWFKLTCSGSECAGSSDSPVIPWILPLIRLMMDESLSSNQALKNKTKINFFDSF